jgi:glycerol kinase
MVLPGEIEDFLNRHRVVNLSHREETILPYILALDQGTTSSRAILFDARGEPRAVAQKEHRQIFPYSGWVEHDAMEIWQSQLAVAKQAIQQLNIAPADIAAIGIANQRETTVLWDRSTCLPVYNAIVWQDRRTAPFCDSLKFDGLLPVVQQKTGLVIDAYFSASKLRWLLDNVPGARASAERGDLAFGTIDSWLLWNLTAGKVHATDASNASRTMLYDIRTGQWDAELLAALKIPRQVLPQVRSSSELFGETNLFGNSIPITGMAGDQQAALFGQTCFSSGLAKNTYGTGCFMLMHVGDSPAVSKHQLLSTVAWQIGAHREYALEGSVFVGGAVVRWLRDGLGLIQSASDVEKLAASVEGSGGVYFVPAFAGLGAPHWDQYARGSISGLTAGTGAGHIARAALESIAFQVADLLDVMRHDSSVAITQLRVDGGAAANDLLMQFQADLLRVPVVRPKVTETTALGAAYLAGLGVGFYKSRQEVAAHWQIERVFEPRLPEDQAAHRRRRWNQALQRSRDWEEHDK